ncbi:hypothetical protein BH23ACT6_BH23ACT6_18370 [soil metagenome]
MSTDYYWVCIGADEAAEDARPVENEFPTQADAETWLGEEWPALADSGVATVSLMCDGELVYGPMSLSA